MSIILECPDGSTIKMLTGVKVIEPVKYWVTGGTVPTRWWQRRREEWFVETEYTRLGPFDTQAEAVSMQRMANRW